MRLPNCPPRDGERAEDFFFTRMRNPAVLDNPPPAYITFDVDVMALAVTVGATLLATLASGLLPASMSSRADTNAALRERRPRRHQP